jgi:hypothetical protein
MRLSARQEKSPLRLRSVSALDRVEQMVQRHTRQHIHLKSRNSRRSRRVR